jgi:hypothetical protein
LYNSREHSIRSIQARSPTTLIGLGPKRLIGLIHSQCPFDKPQLECFPKWAIGKPSPLLYFKDSPKFSFAFENHDWKLNGAPPGNKTKRMVGSQKINFVRFDFLKMNWHSQIWTIIQKTRFSCSLLFVYCLTYEVDFWFS